MALLQVNFISNTLKRTVPVNVVLPVDKLFGETMDTDEQKPFQTLYLLHGILGNYTDWISQTNIDVTYEETEGIHDWEFWKKQIEKVLDWLPLNHGSLGIDSGHVQL